MRKVLSNIKPLLLLVLINALGVTLLYLNNIQSDSIIFLCAVVCCLSAITYVIITVRNLGDPYLFIIISLLSSIGVIMQTRINPSGGIRQIVLYLLGVVCYFVVLFVYRALNKNLRRYTIYYWGISIVLYIVTIVLSFLMKEVTRGARNWIVIGKFSIQPAEFIRILFVLSMAAIFTNARYESSRIIKTKLQEREAKKLRQTRLILAGVIAFSNAMFLFFQNEWGLALLFFAIYISFLYIYGDSKLFLGANLLLVVFAAFIGFKITDHIKVRVDIWLNPFEDASGKGYQIIQSLFAICSGGFGGRGIGTGSPGYIPIVESDSIFAALCEELGVLGGIAILMVYFLLVYRGFKIALSSTNHFNKAVAMGLSVMLGIQTFIIVGGITKLIPLTGITLPFISYGGSSMLSTFIVVGILQAISGAKGEITDEIE